MSFVRQKSLLKDVLPNFVELVTRRGLKRDQILEGIQKQIVDTLAVLILPGNETEETNECKNPYRKMVQIALTILFTRNVKGECIFTALIDVAIALQLRRSQIVVNKDQLMKGFVNMADVRALNETMVNSLIALKDKYKGFEPFFDLLLIVFPDMSETPNADTFIYRKWLSIDESLPTIQLILKNIREETLTRIFEEKLTKFLLSNCETIKQLVDASKWTALAQVFVTNVISLENTQKMILGMVPVLGDRLMKSITTTVSTGIGAATGLASSVASTGIGAANGIASGVASMKFWGGDRRSRRPARRFPRKSLKAHRKRHSIRR